LKRQDKLTKSPIHEQDNVSKYRKFNGDDALATMAAVCKCSFDEARDYLLRYLKAQMIQPILASCKGPSDKHQATYIQGLISSTISSLHMSTDSGPMQANFTSTDYNSSVAFFDPSLTYILTLKAEWILRDVKSGKLSAESPETSIILMTSTLNKPILLTYIIYLDREKSGQIKLGPNMTQLLVSLLLGKCPNTTRMNQWSGNDEDLIVSLNTKGSKNSITSSSSAEFPSPKEPNHEIQMICPIKVSNYVFRLKTYSHTFTGSQLLEWIMRYTSVLNLEECAIIGGLLIKNAFITCLNSNHLSAECLSTTNSSTSFSEESTLLLPTKDSHKLIYQPTLTACEMSGWSESEMPSVTDSVKSFIKRISTIGEHESTSATTSTNSLHSDRSTSATSSNNSLYYTRKSFISRKSFQTHSENPVIRKMMQMNSFASSSTDSIHAESQHPSRPLKTLTVNTHHGNKEEEQFGWETCHTKLISMDGSQQQGAIDNMADDSSNGTMGLDNLTSILSRACYLKEESTTLLTPLPQMVEMSANIKKLMENTSNPSKLQTILLTPELLTSFRSCLQSMFCDENLQFWEDVHSFRTQYSIGTVVPGQPLTPTIAVTSPISQSATISSFTDAYSKDFGTPSMTLIVHALAIFMKFIIPGSPYEINVPKALSSSLTDTIFQFTDICKLIPPEYLSPSTCLDPIQLVRAVQNNGSWDQRVDSRVGRSGQDFHAGMFDKLEAHVFTMMASDSVPKFVKSGWFK
jgi:hypothetical protein